MSNRIFLTGLFWLAVYCGVISADDTPPNFVVILCDNLGYGDIGCFGSSLHRTPHIDRMANEGMRLTSFYSTSGVCTSSRASLLTGCYPRRVGLGRTDPDGDVLRPVSRNGLHPDEITLAEILQRCGYVTACIGKWHLGDQPPFLPTRQGFDSYYGIPYSDDMTADVDSSWPELPLLRNELVVEAPADRATLTKRYTQEAVRFLEEQRHQPFFLYLAHAMPGSTNRPFASEDFRGRSTSGPYGDSLEEIDWSTGEILATLRQLQLDDRTLVVWTSDNGAPHRDPPQGSNRPLGGWGYTTREGGMRVPCIARWPGKIPDGSECHELASMMDLLPTFARLSEGELPCERVTDGHDIWPLLSGQPGAVTPYRAFYYYHADQLRGVRAGKWKLIFSAASSRPVASRFQLYDLDNDLEESTNLVPFHPQVVQRLTRLANEARDDLGDGDLAGRNCRPVGRVSDALPLVPSS